MVQRALTKDDSRGVGEPLIEECEHAAVDGLARGALSRCAIRYWLGDLSSRFHVTLGAKNNILQRTKEHHMQLTYPLLPFIGVDLPPASQQFSPMIQALPGNVELLSLNTQYEQVGTAAFWFELKTK